jgi:hypothetical protein
LTTITTSAAPSSNKKPDTNALGNYTTEIVSRDVQKWITAQIVSKPGAKTFAYMSHEAVHEPMEVPARYIGDECKAVVGETYPTRMIYCGMVRAVDESVRNITATYKKLGIFDQTLVVFSTDSGGR